MLYLESRKTRVFQQEWVIMHMEEKNTVIYIGSWLNEVRIIIYRREWGSRGNKTVDGRREEVNIVSTSCWRMNIVSKKV